MGEEESVGEMGMEDDWLQLRVVFEARKPAKFWRYPVETISQSEGGFERVYQGSCLVLAWEVVLPPQGVFETSVQTRLLEISR
jgi:alpha-amylase